MPDIDQQMQQLLEAGITLPDEKRIYFNGFVGALSPVDVVIVLQQNGKPITVLNCSVIAAKGLALALKSLVDEYEGKTKIEIPSIDTIQKSLAGGSS